MSYVNESTASLSDFVSKLDTFLTGTPGWTQDQLDTGTGKWAIHNTGGSNSSYISARWDTGAPNYLGIYQALGYTGGQDPGNHPSDSGNGILSFTDATIGTGRHATITNSPVQYWAFEDDYYCHVVVEAATGQFTHFGFGALDKIGDWTGGEYCYGFRQQIGYATTVAVLVGSSVLMDGLTKGGGGGTQPASMNPFAATFHAEGLPNEAGASKWAVCMGDEASGSLGTDRATNARIHVTGGFRGGPIARSLGRYSADTLKGLVPMYPIGMFYWDRTTGDAYYLGSQPAVRGCSVQHFTGGDEITMGSDTWVVFPTYVKWSSGIYTNTSTYQGIAYKKVTT